MTATKPGALLLLGEMHAQSVKLILKKIGLRKPN